MSGPEVIIAAAVLQGVGQINQTKSEAAAANETARNLKYSGLMAKAAAIQRENASRKKNRQVLGEQRAAFAQSGVDPSSGSALDIQGDTFSNVELDALMLRHKGDLDKAEADTQANQFRRKADDIQAALPLKLAGTALMAAASYGAASSAAAARQTAFAAGSENLSLNTSYISGNYVG